MPATCSASAGASCRTSSEARRGSLGAAIAAAVLLAAPLPLHASAYVRVLVPDGVLSMVPLNGVAIAFEGEPRVVKVTFHASRDKDLRVVLSGPDAALVAAIETLSGDRVSDGCFSYDLVRSHGEVIDVQSGAFDLPPRRMAEAFARFAPCSGTLPAGQYVVRWATASGAIAGSGYTLPHTLDVQKFEYRRIATLGDEFDRHYMRVIAMMIQDRWDEADGVADAALLALPFSSALYHLRAMIAEERLDAAAALNYAERAVALIENREDTVLFERRSAADVARDLALYRAQRDRLRGRSLLR